MTSVHTVRPTDLAALVGYDGRVYPNEAITRDRMGTEAAPHLLETALEQWFSFATGRHTWISVRGATLRGLVSARRRGSKAAWEIDCLIDASADDPGVLISMLDQVAVDAGRAGAEKVFLRTAAGSHVTKTAIRCGFSGYLTERLLAVETRPVASGPAAVSGAGPRRWSRADAYPTFQLYNRWTPEAVRRVEAATFREWTATRERVSPPRGARQTVLERQGRVVGWLRLAAVGELGRFDLMADPAQPELLDELIEAALARLEQPSRLLSLVPEFATGLRERLERRGFVERGEFLLFARRTTRTITAPEIAGTAQAETFLA